MELAKVFWEEYLFGIGPVNYQKLKQAARYWGQYIPLTLDVCGILIIPELKLEMIYQIPTTSNINDFIQFRSFLMDKSLSVKLPTELLFGAGFIAIESKLYFSCLYCRIEIDEKYWSELLTWIDHCIEVYKISRNIHPKLISAISSSPTTECSSFSAAPTSPGATPTS